MHEIFSASQIDRVYKWWIDWSPCPSFLSLYMTELLMVLQMAGYIALISSWRFFLGFPSDMQPVTRLPPGMQFLWALRVTARVDGLSTRWEINGHFSVLDILGYLTPIDEVPEWRTWYFWSWLQYKFIVDGEWRHDEQQAHMADSHGHVNNWVLITRQHHHIHPPAPDMVTSGITMDVDQEMVHQVVST